MGTKQVPETMSMDPALCLRAMLNPFVALGIAALILALLTRMALLSLADLSFVLPVTAAGYVINEMGIGRCDVPGDRGERPPAKQTVSARGLARLLHTIARRRRLILGVAGNAVSFFTFVALVQTEPLSFVVPASSARFVLETVLAKFVLHEGIGGRRAAGALALLAGVVLVADRPSICTISAS
jgi:drug/metabolite transporter (DMT)-like permease